MSQTDKILKHLKRHGSITKLQMLNCYGVMNGGGRILELRRSHNIETEMITVPSGKRVARYRLRRSSARR